MQVNMYGAADAARKRLAEQTAQQGDQGDANQGNTAASHELLHALGFCARIIISVALQEIDNAPDTETGTERDNEGLKNGDCLFKKCHIVC